MPILPVLDLKHGQVVRGVAGRRDEYRPIVSTLTESCSPRAVARALHDGFGLTEFYIADLDAIGGAFPAAEIYESIVAEGFRLWVDAGVRTVDDAGYVSAMGAATVVVGLETIRGPDTLRDIVRMLGPSQVVFSLDMNCGEPLGNLGPWGVRDAWAITQRAIEAGVVRLLVLDLAQVGTGAGPATADFCSRLRREHPDREITTGGGVRGPDDVQELYACGVDYVLVASALHDARITRDDVEVLSR